jgi:oligosaccharide translocation protein RFT1
MASDKGAGDSTHSAQSVLSASVKGTTFLILVQVISRALTFTVNQLLLRFLSPQLLGVSVQLELYSVSVLYFARESVRVATQRRTEDIQDETEGSRGPGKAPQIMSGAMKMQGIVNIAYVPILFGLPFAWGLGSWYLSQASDQVLSTPHFEDSLKVFGLAALLELFTEPCFLILQQKMLYKTRAVTETAATILKCFISFGFTVYAYRSGRDWGVLPFALGQMGFAVTVFLSYFWNVGQIATSDGFSLQAKPISSPYGLRSPL